MILGINIRSSRLIDFLLIIYSNTLLSSVASSARRRFRFEELPKHHQYPCLQPKTVVSKERRGKNISERTEDIHVHPWLCSYDSLIEERGERGIL
jgi:hypothetical protein